MPERVMKRPGAAVRGHDIAAVNVNAGMLLHWLQKP